MIDQQSGTSTDTAYHTSILVDSSGFAHIAYAHDFADNDLEYASNESGSWVAEKVDDSGTVGYRSDIVVEPSGGITIVYERLDAGSRSLQFALRETGTWAPYLLSSSSSGPVSADVGSDDKLHIVFSDLGGELTYLRGE